jgi:hypothetical protein
MTTRSVVAAALLCAFAVGSASAKNAPHVPGPALPNHRLTPGSHSAVGKAKVCRAGYAAGVRVVEGVRGWFFAYGAVSSWLRPALLAS